MNVSMTVSNIIILMLHVNKITLLEKQKTKKQKNNPHWRKGFKQNFKINFMAGLAQ